MEGSHYRTDKQSMAGLRQMMDYDDSYYHYYDDHDVMRRKRTCMALAIISHPVFS